MSKNPLQLTAEKADRRHVTLRVGAPTADYYAAEALGRLLVDTYNVDVYTAENELADNRPAKFMICTDLKPAEFVDALLNAIEEKLAQR
jgi:hypothetical protein